MKDKPRDLKKNLLVASLNPAAALRNAQQDNTDSCQSATRSAFRPPPIVRSQFLSNPEQILPPSKHNWLIHRLIVIGVSDKEFLQTDTRASAPCNAERRLSPCHAPPYLFAQN